MKETPEGWRFGRIDQFLVLQRGFDLTQKEAREGDVPVVSSSGVSYYHNVAKVQPPGVVTGRKGKLGGVYFIDVPFWPHDTTLWVKDFKNNEPKFVKLFLEGFSLERFDAATSVPTLNRNNVHKLRVSFPPLAEQRRIVEIVDAWDEAIALTDRRIEAARQRKKGLMQRLLTGRVRFPEFEEGEWQKAHLRSIATINPPKPKHLSDDTLVSFVAMADVSENAQIIRASERPYKEVSTGYTPFQDNDVIVAKITPCFENGKGALVKGLKNGVGFGSTEFHVIRANDTKILPEFLYYHTIAHDFRGRGESNMAGSAGQKRIRTDFLKAYKIPLPPIAEQRRIAAVLQACDREIDLLTQKRDALQRQKKGLMQRLLTGRVRVNV